MAHQCHKCGRSPARVRLTEAGGGEVVAWGCDDCYPGHRTLAARLGRLTLAPAVILTGAALAFRNWPLGIVAAIFWGLGLSAAIQKDSRRR